MKISEWLKVNTDPDSDGLTVSELIEHFRESTGCQDHKAEILAELVQLGITVGPGDDPPTNRRLRTREPGDSFEGWLNQNTTIINDLTIGDSAQKVVEMYCLTQKIPHDAGTYNALIGELTRLRYTLGEQSYLKLNSHIERR